MLRFDPPANSTFSEIYPGNGWISCGWQRLEAWKGSRGYREIARDLGCSPALLTLYKQGKTPAKHYLEKLESLADVPPIAWKHWICIDPDKAAEFDGKGPLTIEALRSGLDWLRRDLPRDTASAATIQLVLTIRESREDFEPAYVPADPLDTCAGLMDALLAKLEPFARELVAEMWERTRTRTKNAA